MEKKEYEFDTIANTIFAPIYPVIAGQIVVKTGITQGVCLDIGSSGGHLGIAMKEITDLQVLLMDKSETALTIAVNRIAEGGHNGRIKVLLGDVQQIPLEENSVDVAVSRGSVWFWEDKYKAFNEIYRVLKSGGAAYIGGGFGTAELREEVAVKMNVINNGKWAEKQKSIRGDNSSELFAGILNELELPYEIVDDDSGLWIVIYKR